MPLSASAAWLAVFAALAAGFPPYPGLALLDRLGFLALGIAGGWLLYRFGAVAALPDEDGLTIRNVLGRRRLDWAQVVSVRYGRDSTFGQLDLSDGTTVSILAIQAADGDYGARLATRLATLVELHGSDRGR